MEIQLIIIGIAVNFEVELEVECDCGALSGVCTRQTSEFIFLLIQYSYYVVSPKFLQYGLAWTPEPGKVIFGNVYTVVG